MVRVRLLIWSDSNNDVDDFVYVYLGDDAMIKINLIVVGKLKEKFWTDAVNEYTKRISRFATIKIIELQEGKNLSEEGEEIIKKTTGYVIVTDVNGELIKSEDIANIFAKALNEGKSTISVIIGSSEGLCDKVKLSADKRVSFGRVTYPHQLMRVIACEQIYRALTIMNNVTYHK